MKKIVFIFSVAFLLFGFSERNIAHEMDQLVVSNLAIENAGYLSIDEKKMLQEINIARTQPNIYLNLAKDLLVKTVEDSVRLTAIVSESIKKRVVYENYGEVVTIDTTYNNYYLSRHTAIKELIAELTVATPLTALMPNEAMYLSAKNHGESQTANNYIDHNGLDGSWPVERLRRDVSWITEGNENIISGIGSPREMVLQLLVDSGVEKRGHRHNILNPNWSHFACYNVVTLNNGDYKWWIQEFAY